MAGLAPAIRFLPCSEAPGRLIEDEAMRAQSSYSGLKVGGRFSSQPSLPRIGPNLVSTSVACRFSLCRLTG